MTEPFVTISSEYIPALPNTGFAPLDAAGLAFAAVLLFAVGLAVFPYVRQAVVTLAR